MVDSNQLPDSTSPVPVKETTQPVFKERSVLKKIIFTERAYTYSTLRNALEVKGQRTSRQYLYGIVTGRLTPSYAFAVKLCEILGVKVETCFNMADFKKVDFWKEEQ